MDRQLPTRLPTPLTFGAVAVCILPFFLHLLGADFGASPPPLDPVFLRGAAPIEGMYRALSGSFIHSLLEWSALCAALATAALSMVHYRLERDAVTPVFGLALFSAACVDAFHTLAGDRLIAFQGAPVDILNATWAISRVFNAGITLIVGGIFLLWPRDRERPGLGLVLLAGALFAVAASGLIAAVLTASQLPQTLFPNAFFKRPWEILPLLLFILSGAIVYPRFYARYPGVFTEALILSAIPQILSQFHMAFGSREMFDSHANIAHFLKIVAYLIPFVGICIDYVYRLQLVRLQSVELTRAMKELAESNHKLLRSNEELEQFAYIASHDLKAPLRALSSLATWIEEDLDDRAAVTGHLEKMQGRLRRMETLLSDLLRFSRVGREDPEIREVDTGALARELIALIDPPPEVRFEISPEMPVLQTATAPLEHVLLNLIGNAVKHRDHPDLRVQISCKDEGAWLRFLVIDDGAGIPEPYREKIFRVFQTLRPRDDVESSGMGLAFVKKIVQSAGGQVGVEGASPKGSAFAFTWPRVWPGVVKSSLPESL